MSIGGQDYYFGNNKGVPGLYGADGKKYEGDDEYANKVVNALTKIANTDDSEVQERLGAMMESKSRVQIEKDQNFQLDHTDVVLVKGKNSITRQSVESPEYDPKNKNIVGVIVNWSGFDGGGVGEISKKGIAGDIGLAHELLIRLPEQ